MFENSKICTYYSTPPSSSTNSLDINKYEKTVGGNPKGQGDYTEITLNRTTGRVSMRVMHPDDYITDFPRVHDAHVGQPTNKYSYLATIAKDRSSVAFDGFIKVEHGMTGPNQGCLGYVPFGERCFGGEVVFVPRQGATEEDDGFLMTYVFHDAEQTSRLHIWSAKTLEPLAQVQLPSRVPYGFHGLYITGKEVKQTQAHAA